MFVSEKFCAVKKEQLTTESKPLLTMYLANPRGFCAGVDRAVKIVEAALEVYGAPVYVRHEIVHNAWVVDSLRKKGAVFVEETEECPDDRPIVVSAHGAPRHVFGEIKKRNIICVDATCPLVTKVHMEARHHNQQGRHVVLIGHQGHPEVVGTLGQLDDEKHITLVETMQDVEKLEIPDSDNLACVTQTTLSVDDTAEILFALRVRCILPIGCCIANIILGWHNNIRKSYSECKQYFSSIINGKSCLSNARKII
jgi:4-hydroxy-3-methylbut-2-enyl diphosphate reductase